MESHREMVSPHIIAGREAESPPRLILRVAQERHQEHIARACCIRALPSAWTYCASV